LASLYAGTPPVEYPGLLEHIAEVDVGVQEVGVQGHRLLKVVDGQPYFTLPKGYNSIKVIPSDEDPDPLDPYVFGPPGSGFISRRYGSGSGSGSGSFYNHAKIV
jgi:hypothetical protein